MNHVNMADSCGCGVPSCPASSFVVQLEFNTSGVVASPQVLLIPIGWHLRIESQIFQALVFCLCHDNSYTKTFEDVIHCLWKWMIQVQQHLADNLARNQMFVNETLILQARFNCRLRPILASGMLPVKLAPHPEYLINHCKLRSNVKFRTS